MKKYWLEPYQEFIQYKKINEGLTKSYSIELFDKKLQKLLNNYDYKVEIKEYDMIELFIDFSTIKDKIGFFKKIDSLSNIMGYYIVRLVNNKKIIEIPYFPKIKNFDDTIIYFIKNFDDEVNDIKYFYHLTLNDLWEDKIMKKEIKPKNSLMVVQNDKEKVYLLSNMNNIGGYIHEKINDMKKNGNHKYYNIYDWVALKIIKPQNMRIFKDKKMVDSFYTLEPIPISSIINVTRNYEM